MNTLPTIFVVEPDLAMCESIRRIAGVMELGCEAFASGQEFLDAFDRERPGCLVLEIRIPGVNGLQIQQRLTEAGSVMPMVFLTASASVSIAVHAMRMGAFHFLEKPFHEHDLWTTIQEAVHVDRERRKVGSAQAAIDARLGTLSERELTVLELLADCKTKGAMAEEMGVSVRTIEHHRTQLMRKLKTNSIAGLLRFALTLNGAGSRYLDTFSLPTRNGNGNGGRESNHNHSHHAAHLPNGAAGTNPCPTGFAPATTGRRKSK